MHFFQYLFQGNEGGFPWYVTVFNVFFPNMEGFSIVGMGSWSGKPFSFGYIALLVLYAILYMTFVTTLACEFFDKKECT